MRARAAMEAEPPAGPELLAARRGAVGRIVLNRPKALNALSLPMIRAFASALAGWEEDPGVRAVTVEGAGGRAFCAGGDVLAVCGFQDTDSALGADFFREEYRLNRRLRNYPKPVVAFLDGITMGGGVGLSVHGSHRVATGRTLFAMPETALGLFPDVGAGHFLPRLRGEFGTYLALSGARLGAGDCLAAGIATHALAPDAAAEAAVAALAAMEGDDVDRALAPHLGGAPPPTVLRRCGEIDRCFQADRVEEILEALAREGSAWGNETRAGLLEKSPTSMKITLRQLRMGRKADFDEELVTEYRMSQACVAGHDFPEGVRAALVDRDGSPQWSPGTLEEVGEDLVASHFAVPAAGDLTFP